MFFVSFFFPENHFYDGTILSAMFFLLQTQLVSLSEPRPGTYATQLLSIGVKKTKS
jgi:hypothetical protein